MREQSVGWLRLQLPVGSSLDPAAAAIAAGAVIATFVFQVGMLPLLGGCAAAGLAWRLAAGRPDARRAPTMLPAMRVLDVTTSVLASLLRGGTHAKVGALGPRPAEPLVLYEFESCPFCRRVREALSLLDLDARILPCPKRGHRFRDELIARGGKAQFPYLVDPNTGKEMYESAEIVAYLFSRYGAGPAPAALTGPFSAATGAPISLLRGGRGTFARPSRAPARPLELWSYEASPFSRIVRERLCELELPYLLHNVAKGSPRRPAFAERSGKLQVPYLVDPNTERRDVRVRRHRGVPRRQLRGLAGARGFRHRPTRSHASSIALTVSGASCCTQWPMPGRKRSVRFGDVALGRAHVARCRARCLRSPQSISVGVSIVGKPCAIWRR